MTKRQKLTLAQKISQIQAFVKALKKLQKEVSRKKFFSEEMIRRLVERYLQLALEGVLDIAEQLIAEEGFTKPKEYRDAILILGECKVLPSSFAFHFAPAAGFRNILVHDYVKLDNAKVFEHFKKDSADIEKFLRYVAKFLRKK